MLIIWKEPSFGPPPHQLKSTLSEGGFYEIKEVYRFAWGGGAPVPIEDNGSTPIALLDGSWASQLKPNATRNKKPIAEQALKTGQQKPSDV